MKKKKKEMDHFHTIARKMSLSDWHLRLTQEESGWLRKLYLEAYDHEVFLTIMRQRTAIKEGNEK